jgi:hypothetical protein
VVDTLTAIGNWGTIYAGKNTIILTYDGFGWVVSQDTALISQSQVENLESDLDAKAGVAHTHTQDDITGLAGELAAKQNTLTAGDNITIVGDVISAPGSGAGVDFSVGTTITADNVAVPIWTNSLAENETIFADAWVSGRGPTNKYSFKIAAQAYRATGDAVLSGTNTSFTIPSGGTNMLAYWSVTSSNLLLNVRGFENENVPWDAKGFYLKGDNGDESAGEDTSWFTQNLLLVYNFDEAANTDAADDTSGNNLDAAIGGASGPIPATGLLTGARENATTRYFNLADDAVFDAMTNGFTATFWIYPTEASLSATKYIWGQYNSGNTAFSVQETSSEVLSVTIEGPSITRTLSHTTTLSANTWYFVAVRYDGASSTIKLQVDSTEVSRTDADTAMNNSTAAMQWFRRVANASYFLGRMDAFRLYGTVLTDDQVNYIYNSGTGRQ